MELSSDLAVVENIRKLPSEVFEETTSHFCEGFPLDFGALVRSDTDVGQEGLVRSLHLVSKVFNGDARFVHNGDAGTGLALLFPCHQILLHLEGHRSAVDVVENYQKFQRAGINLDWKAVQEIISLLSFNFRSAAKTKLTADDLVTKLGECTSKWSKSTLQVMHQLWTEHGSLVQAHQEVQAVASIGQLVDIQWKLGMAVSSDTCRSLNSPYVSVLMKTADTSGEISYKSFEMTVLQFQNFYRQFQEIASVLETV